MQGCLRRRFAALGKSGQIALLINAIKQLKGVLEVAPNIVNSSDWLAEERVRNDLGKKLFEALYPHKKG